MPFLAGVVLLGGVGEAKEIPSRAVPVAAHCAKIGERLRTMLKDLPADLSKKGAKGNLSAHVGMVKPDIYGAIAGTIAACRTFVENKSYGCGTKKGVTDCALITEEIQIEDPDVISGIIKAEISPIIIGRIATTDDKIRCFMFGREVEELTREEKKNSGAGLLYGSVLLKMSVLSAINACLGISTGVRHECKPIKIVDWDKNGEKEMYIECAPPKKERPNYPGVNSAQEPSTG